MNNIYKYLVDNNLLEEFLMNFRVTRRVQEMKKERFPGEAYYIDGRDRVKLEIYRYQYQVKTIYSVFGHDYVTSEVIYGQSVNEDDIPFKKKGKFTTTYCNLSGEENVTYLFDGRKNVMSKYGKSGVFDLPSDVCSIFFNDKDFSLFLSLFYTYIKDKENIDVDDIYSIRRLIQITKEMKSLKKERDEIIESLVTDYVIIKK